MSLKKLIETAKNKEKFTSIADYINFSLRYLEFIKTHLQAVIVSRNENHYRFFQYKKDGAFRVTRAINSNLMLGLEDYEKSKITFNSLLKNIKDEKFDTEKHRNLLNNFIYTTQQSIGATLDALPSKNVNNARKVNGDLFERFILLIIADVGVNVRSGTIKIPVKIDGTFAFNMRYQHDLIIEVGNDTKAIGSVKTSTKDRLDKIFIDKFLFNKLTGTNTPHFAICLNDVQRKGPEGKYGISGTFLPGHFKGYTIKLNPLDGVYYCDIRPNMRTETILKDHIKTFDHFLFSDIWKFIE